jgi:hypothetical protein
MLQFLISQSDQEIEVVMDVVGHGARNHNCDVYSTEGHRALTAARLPEHLEIVKEVMTDAASQTASFVYFGYRRT